jgi:RNA polymerase-binding transcription factor DksA
MSANLTAQVIENTPNANDGSVWHRLHAEREDICETLLREPLPDVRSDDTEITAEDGVSPRAWHRELLEWRLRKVDDALDRLMSGSYGNCSKCGKWIEDTKLEFDPAVEFCLSCWERLQTGNLKVRNARARQHPTASLDPATKADSSPDGVWLKALAPFDTICVKTRNSDYRIFILDPAADRALIEGGHYFTEPVEAMVNGSLGSSTYKVGWIGIGLRMEFWANGNIIQTSPIQSFHIEHQTAHDAFSSSGFQN